ncbi:hypothetical protein C5S53_12320 [Methanophagales archaeon]|nr:hypothetical protein C5S53_12320 [Methanophagales archaeon]
MKRYNHPGMDASEFIPMVERLGPMMNMFLG